MGDQNGKDGTHVGPALDHCHNVTAHAKDTNKTCTSDAVEFFSHDWKMPMTSKEEKVLQPVTDSTHELKTQAKSNPPFNRIGTPTLQAPQQLAEAFQKKQKQSTTMHQLRGWRGKPTALPPRVKESKLTTTSTTASLATKQQQKLNSTMKQHTPWQAC